MEEYIRKAFKSLEDFKVEIEPKSTKLVEFIEEEESVDSLTIRELFEKESSYIITHDFEFDGHSYSLFLEALCDGESCDIQFEEFDINNVTEVLAEVLDSEHDFIGSLTGEDITLDTTVGETIEKSHSVINGEEEISSEEEIEVSEEEPEANERVFVNGDPEMASEEEVVEIEPEVKESVLVESEKFNLNSAEEVKEAEKVLKKSGKETIEQIVDATAESTEDLKKSYIGSTILQCTTCKSMMYKDPDQVVPVEGEENLFNIDDECPHCGAHDGFNRIGTVASLEVDPFAEPVPPMVEKEPEVEAEPGIEVEEEETVEIEPEVEETHEELETPEEEHEEGKESEKQEQEEDSEVEDKEKEESEEKKEEEEKSEGEEPLNEEVPVKVYTEDEIFDAVEGSLKHSGDSTTINIDGKVFVCDLEDVPENGVPEDGNFEFTGCEVTSDDIGVQEDGTLFMDGCQPEKHYIVKEGKIESEELTEKCEGEECSESKEECESGEECHEEHSEEESKECEGEKCEEECEKKKELRLESLDTNKFDRLVTRYLKETYSNVKSYSSINSELNNDENKVIVEGTITFKSEKTKPTKFIFEAKEMTAKGQLKLVGINEMFSTNKAFTLLGDVDNNKLLSESLAYRYEVGGKKVRGKAESFKKR